MKQKDAVSSSQSRKVFILLLLLCPFGLLCCYFFYSPWFLIHKDVCWEHPISFEAPMDAAGRVSFLLLALYRPLCLNRRKDSLLYIYTPHSRLSSMKRERKMALPRIYIYISHRWRYPLLLLAGSKKRHSSLWCGEARGSITPRALHSCECLTPFAITRLRNYRILSLYSNCSSLSLINPERDFITADVLRSNHYCLAAGLFFLLFI